MRRMAELVSRDRLSERAAADHVSHELSGDHRHSEGLRKDYRRLKKAGGLPKVEDSFALLREQVQAELEKRAQQAASIAAEIAPLEAELRGLGFSVGGDLDSLVKALDQRRFELVGIFGTFPLGPRMAGWLAGRGFDPEGAEAEARRLVAEREKVHRALEIVHRLRDLYQARAVVTPQRRTPTGEQ